MRSFSIIEVTDQRWTELVSSAYQYDFYHTKSYSQLERNNRPVLLVAFYDKNFIAIPLIIREIEKTDLYDCTSVYGYCGPVSNLPFESLSKEHILYFQTELLSFFIENKIVSVFSRLHPILNQSPVFENFGTLRIINQTIAIDLTLPKAEQYNRFRKNHRKDIERLRGNGFIVSEASTCSEVDCFIQNYYDLMNRVNADKSYFFSRKYIFRMLDNPCFESKLLLVKRDSDIAGGSLLTFTNDIIQSHLSCDNIKYRFYSPIKLVFDEARLLGCDLKMKYFHLGGGRHGSSDDSLFHFKAGFSDTRFVFRGWELIIDDAKYAYLLGRFNTNAKKARNYFPAYRINETLST